MFADSRNCLLVLDTKTFYREFVCQEFMYRAEHHKFLPCKCSKDIAYTQSPQTPAEVGWHDIVTQRCVVRFHVGRRRSVSKLLENRLGTTLETEETSKSVGVCQRPVRYNGNVKQPEEHKRIVAPPALAELVAKVEHGCVVDELEQTHQRKHFGFIVVSQQPPFGKVDCRAIKFVAAEPGYRKKEKKLAIRKKNVTLIMHKHLYTYVA